MYILEGNIGVGKSTFLELVKQQTPEVNNLQIQILTEPVDDWSKQSYGQSLLANFYQDASRWAYTMETLTMFCRVRDYVNEQENNDPNRIIERSVYSGHYCFAQNHYQSGYLTELEWKIYSQWVD
ncbi:deoxynucleoside kinase, partial [Candidatus Babeliales bacterium]|nr:deoxynucleoside kinase [Candidatus Babeliales bacterium]